VKHLEIEIDNGEINELKLQTDICAAKMKYRKQKDLLTCQTKVSARLEMDDLY
jgi:hypothetical protein